MIVVNEKSISNLNACVNIAKELPDFFNQDGIRKIGEALKKDDVYLYVESEEVLGFATIDRKNDFVAEISWMAIDRNQHRNGIGSKLIDFISKALKDKGYKLLEVKTLSEIEDYEPYERTRNFYRKNSFILLETINPYPAWGAENPCDIYVKIL